MMVLYGAPDSLATFGASVVALYYNVYISFVNVMTFWPTVLSVEPLVQCVVCRLSVTFCIVAKRCILAKKCLKE